MWSILENVTCALEKKVYSSAFGQTIKSVFMFKEENTLTVTQRIYDVNKLTRRLVRLKTELDRTPLEQAEIDANKKPEFKQVHCE